MYKINPGDRRCFEPLYIDGTKKISKGFLEILKNRYSRIYHILIEHRIPHIFKKTAEFKNSNSSYYHFMIADKDAPFAKLCGLNIEYDYGDSYHTVKTPREYINFLFD